MPLLRGEERHSRTFTSSDSNDHKVEGTEKATGNGEGKEKLGCFPETSRNTHINCSQSATLLFTDPAREEITGDYMERITCSLHRFIISTEERCATFPPVH